MQKKLWTAQLFITIGTAIVLPVSTPHAQQAAERRVMTFQKGEVFFLNEFGAVVTKGDSGLTVAMSPPPDSRTKAYRDVDLKEKDVVMMFNGKRMKTIADLQGRYDSLKPGDEIKLGIRRGGEMRIVAFPKVDQSTLPQTQRIMLRGDADTAQAQTTGAPQTGVMRTWSGGASGGEIIALPEMGLVFTEKDSAVVIASILPNAEALFHENIPAEGDVVKAIGGKDVRALDRFQEIYDKIPIGETVQLVFIHDKKETAVSAKKTEAPPQKMLIKKQG